MFEVGINDRIEIVNGKLKKIGLKILEIEILYDSSFSCTFDLIETEKYYDYFMSKYGDLDFSDIKEHDDYDQYNYDDQTFIMEELEDSFNFPYAKVRDQDISILSNDLLSDLIDCVDDFLNKDLIE